MTKSIYQILLLLFGLIIIHFLSNQFHAKYDFTKDKRYSLSDTTIDIVKKVDDVINIKVYLEGNFPPEFKRLQSEIKQHLEQLQGLNSQITFHFVNPLGKEKELVEQGLKPSQLAVEENGVASQTVIFPWAIINYKKKKETISFLSNNGKNSEMQIKHAIENMEFQFTDAIHKITKKQRKNIAVLTGNGELNFKQMNGLLKTLAPYYHFEPFPLDSANAIPQKTLQLLQKFDLAIIAKPTKVFTEREKFILDQFQINNGKTLWLIDNVITRKDSLLQTGATIALQRNLNLTDLLFQYGIRIKSNLVKDIYSSSIRLATGKVGGKTEYKNLPWHYHPLVQPNLEHVISNNIPAVGLQYVSTIDTLRNNIKKTVLLQSSNVSKAYGVPLEISFEEIKKKPQKQDYNNGNKILGVLLEGKFNSAYKNRIHPAKIANYMEQSSSNKMIVIADGDIIKNEIHQGKPLDLGVNKWTGVINGNKIFLLNSIQYLLEDNIKLLSLRSKKIQLHYLDKEKVYQEKNYWQIVNSSIPLILLGFFAIIFTIYKKRKYKKFSI